MIVLQEIVKALEHRYTGNNNFRMADFSAFVYTIMNHEDKTGKAFNKFKEIFDKLSLKQGVFTLEEHPIYETLCEWLEQDRPQAEITSDNTTNQDREVKTEELYTEFKELNPDLPYRNVSTFGRKFKEILSDLRKFFFIKMKKNRRGIVFYTIKKKNIEKSDCS
jgi:Cdc6-like AAA superfamily ATPase